MIPDQARDIIPLLYPALALMFAYIAVAMSVLYIIARRPISGAMAMLFYLFAAGMYVLAFYDINQVRYLVVIIRGAEVPAAMVACVITTMYTWREYCIWRLQRKATSEKMF